MVTRAIYTLTEEKEYFGYNFRQVKKWFYDSKVTMLKVLNVIVDNTKIENYDKIKAHDFKWFILDKTPSELNSKLKKLDDTIELSDVYHTQNIINEICNNFMISIELLTNGEGEIYSIQFDENKKNDLEEFAKLIKNNRKLKEECDNTLSFFKNFEKFLKNKYLNHNDIIKVDYAKIKKNGAYFILKEKASYSTELRCIDNLIRELYAIDKVIAPN